MLERFLESPDFFSYCSLIIIEVNYFIFKIPLIPNKAEGTWKSLSLLTIYSVQHRDRPLLFSAFLSLDSLSYEKYKPRWVTIPKVSTHNDITVKARDENMQW